MTYIMSCFSAGQDKLKLKSNFNEFMEMISVGIPPDTEPDAAVAHLTKMINLRDTLKDTKFEISDALTSKIMVHVVEKRGKAHMQEIRMSEGSLTDTVIDSLKCAQGALAGAWILFVRKSQIRIVIL